VSYTRFALGFSRHKKVNAVTDAAFRLWVSAMDRAREQASDGLLDDADLDLIPRCPARGPRRAALVRELCTHGLWEVRENAWQIHDYLDWQDSAEQIKARLANARQRMREVRANGRRTHTDGAREVLSRSSDQISLSGSDLKSGDPDPDARALQDPFRDSLTTREDELPDGWQPSAENQALAVTLGLDPAEEREMHAAHRRRQAYRCGAWDDDFALWLRRSAKMARKGKRGGNGAGSAAEWPTEADTRLREAIRAGRHGKILRAKEQAGQLDAALARRLVREREQAIAEQDPTAAERLGGLTAAIGGRRIS